MEVEKFICKAAKIEYILKLEANQAEAEQKIDELKKIIRSLKKLEIVFKVPKLERKGTMSAYDNVESYETAEEPKFEI